MPSLSSVGTKYRSDFIVGICVLMLMSVVTIPCAALTVIETPFSQSSYNLTPQAEFYIDPSNKIEINEVRKGGLSFRKIERNIYNEGSSSHAHWVRYSLKLNSPTNIELQKCILEIGFAALETVDLYVFEGEKQIAKLTSGTSMPFSQRPIKHHNIVFPLSLPTGTKLDFYLHVKNNGPVSLPITLWDNHSFSEHSANQHIGYGIYLGIMLGLAAYNLFIFISIRSRSYFYYTIHILSVLGMCLGITGIGTQYLWGEYPAFSIHMSLFMAYVAHYCAIEFTRAFLDTGRFCPRIDKFLNIWRFVFALGIPLIFIIPKTLSVSILSLAIIVAITVILSAGVFCFLNRQKIARLFLVAWGVYEFATAVKIASILGILPDTWLVFNATLFGSGVESILLSFALADKINQMKSEQQLLQEKALRESRKSNKLKDQFLATISHELRTPMNGVEGALQLMEQEQLSERCLERVVTAKESATNMTVLIEKILNFSEIQSGKLKLTPKMFPLSKLVQSVEAEANTLLKNKSLDLSINCQLNKSDTYVGDIERISIIVQQLLENAIKFTREGCVSVDIGSKQEEPNFIRVSVTDTGIGIPKENHASIFEAFSQVDASFSRGYGGLGIGLAIANHLAKLMKGEIRLESQTGHGSCFTLCLPLVKGGTMVEEAPVPTEFVSDATSPVILIVEDSEINKMVLSNLLNILGLETLTASNGLEGLHQINKNQVDLVLMDCQMPVMDGFEATQKIRELSGEKSKIPIVAVTANAMTSDRERCLNAGMSDYMKKPVDLTKLRTVLSKWLPNADLSEVSNRS